jgi:hypothetical protein
VGGTVDDLAAGCADHVDIDVVKADAAGEQAAQRHALALLGNGLWRVLSAPAVLAGAWLLTLLVALPAAWLVHDAIASDLGPSLESRAAAEGVNWPWWQEFAVRQPGIARTLGPSVIGFAAVLRNASDLVDGRLPAGPVAAAVTLYIVAWSFLLGGAIDRYARRRTVGTAAFFAACGVYFWRFLRLGVLAALVYTFLFFVVHGWLFDDLFPAVTRDLASERTAFAWRLLLYAVFLVLLGGVIVVFDYARVRAVVEDRRSMIGALGAGARFVRRHLGSAAALFALNVALLLVVGAIYGVASPGASAPLALTLIVGQLYIAARVALRLTVYASAVALFQDRLAHAGYTGAPPHQWSESPAVEAITNAPPRIG